MRGTSDWFFSPKEDGSGISNSHGPSIRRIITTDDNDPFFQIYLEILQARRQYYLSIRNPSKREAKCGQFGKYCKSNRQVFSFSLFLVFSFFPRNPQGNLTNGACEGRVLFIGRGIAWKTLGARDKFLARFAEKRMKSVRKMGDWSVDLFKSTRWMINWKVQGSGRMLGRRVTTSRIFP